MWALMLTVLFPIVFIMALALCVCWRKKSPKNDLLGLDGMVTQKNPDENVNHLPSAAPCVVDGPTPIANSTDSEPNRRPISSTNTRRSLPDIPSEQGAAVSWEPAVDNSSEYYATVEQCQNGKQSTFPNGVESRPSTSLRSSISQADDAFSPYERVKYDKIKSKEHPYAQLRPSSSRPTAPDTTQPSSEERVNLLRTDEASAEDTPSAPPRSRRSSAQSNLEVDIPAASAVAGGIAANPELPYMTPPINQSNFSGDSQDSSKGYTSISVREPLANIISQTKDMNRKQHLDQHYSTVSDDSDDVYTTIPDPNSQIYTSESETYARIEPITVEVDVNPAPTRALNPVEDVYQPEPAPPAASTHSRQASTSSLTPAVSSPKPEKRQANSPLPPPPTGPTFDFHADKVTAKNLDDLYAKVHKNKKKPEAESEGAVANAEEEEAQSASSPSADAFTPREKHRREHNYETLRKTVNREDPGYERVNHEEPGYASIGGPDSITSSDPGYEVLKKSDSTVPKYEEIRRRVSDLSAGYSKIKYSGEKVEEKSSSNSQDLSLDEPNYESMPSESLSTDPNYSDLKSTDSDQNYESVDHPNYERVGEPPYERLQEEDSVNAEAANTLLIDGFKKPDDSDKGEKVNSTSVQSKANNILEDDSIFQV